MAAPQGPCPLPGGARLTGIESRDEAPPAAWSCGMEGGGEERKPCLAERSLRAAKQDEGASEPDVDTCCLCGNMRCRLAAGAEPCASRNAANTSPDSKASTFFH